MTVDQRALMAAQREAALAEQPPYDALIGLVLEAWNTLGSCRSIGMAVGSIPWTAVMAWCDRRPYLDDDLAKAVADAIGYLDANRAKADAAKTKPKTNPRSRDP